jgi:hypothetical protein
MKNFVKCTVIQRMSTIHQIAVIIALAVMFAFASCVSTPASSGTDAVTITVTGIPAGKYDGWDVTLRLLDDTDATLAIGAAEVGMGVASLKFTMLDRFLVYEPFNKAGTYFVFLVFDNNDGDEATYFIESQTIKNGSNSIEYSAFES